MTQLTAEAGYSGALVLGPAPAPLPAVRVPDPPEVPRVRVGSRFDAKQLRGRILAILSGVERAGDVLATLLEQARTKAIHLVLEAPGPGGGYFRDFTEFAVCPAPHGLGLPPALLEVLTQERSDPRRRARIALEQPLAMKQRGGQPGHASTHTGAPKTKRPRLHGGDYVLQRLRRDYPHLLLKVATGELPNIKAAALAAGLNRPMLTCRAEPMAVARMVVIKFDPAQRREIVDLLLNPQRITGPKGRDTAAWKRYKAESAA